VDEPKMSGTYEVIWDGKDNQGQEVASGVYFYKIKAGDYSETKKMILMK
jgi:flagellar hook assembly protein FlgD